jgi:hypothetical protein
MLMAGSLLSLGDGPLSRLFHELIISIRGYFALRGFEGLVIGR